jgi:hypothetical protein
MKVEMGKKYRLKYGSEYKLYAVLENNKGYMEVHGAYMNDEGAWFPISHKLDGTGKTPGFNLVEVSPYDHLKIDDKVIVWNNTAVRYRFKRHFAGIDITGKPLTYPNGNTSFSNKDVGHTPVPWDNCELYNKEKHG